MPFELEVIYCFYKFLHLIHLFEEHGISLLICPCASLRYFFQILRPHNHTFVQLTYLKGYIYFMKSNILLVVPNFVQI